MQELELLRISYEVAQEIIKKTLPDIALPYSTCKELGVTIDMLRYAYRIRGMLRFLFEADVDGFFKDINREAMTYLTLLKAYHSKMDVDDDLVWDPYDSLVCAIAATNFAAVQEIDGLVPEWKDFDDTGIMLRKLVVGGEKDIAAIFVDFKDACEEKGGRDRHKVIITQGLISREIETFNQGLLEYLRSFDTITFEEVRMEMWPGDQYISLEALAFIQLAKRKNIPITVTHKMIPPELQDARLIIPKSGYPVWPG